MNVQLSVGRWGTTKGVHRRLVHGVSGHGSRLMGSAAAAENTEATRTTLAVSTNNAGPRTRVTLTAHVSADHDRRALGSGEIPLRGNRSWIGIFGSRRQCGPGDGHPPCGQPTSWSQFIRAERPIEFALDGCPVQANVSTVAGFTVAAAPTSLSTAVGGFVSSVVTVTPVNGFNAYVSLSCSGLPINTTCTFTPLNVPASCTTNTAGVQTCTPGTSVMQIQTLAPSPGPRRATRVTPACGVMLLFFRHCLALPAWVLASAGPGAISLLGVLALAGAMSMTACAQRYKYLNHGPPGNPGTPVGSYTVTVDAESSNGSLTVTPPTQPQITLTITQLSLWTLTNSAIWTSMELQVRRAVAAEALARFGRGKSELRRAVCRITSGI